MSIVVNDYGVDDSAGEYNMKTNQYILMTKYTDQIKYLIIRRVSSFTIATMGMATNIFRI